MFTVRHLVLGFLLLLMSDAPKMGEVVAMRDGKLPQASEALRLDANSHSSMPGAHAALRAAPKAAKAPGHRYPKQVLTLLNRKRRSLHESKPSSGSTLGSHHASRPSNLLDSLKAAAGNKALPPVFRTRSSTPSIASASEILQPQDLLLVLPICVERLPLARAHRAYTQRLGMATVIVLNANEQQLELLNTEGAYVSCTYRTTGGIIVLNAPSASLQQNSELRHPLHSFARLPYLSQGPVLQMLLMHGCRACLP